MRLIKGLAKLLGFLLLFAVLAAAGMGGYLTLTEYNPADVEPLEVSASAVNEPARVGKMLKAVTFNTGYAGLDRSEDFFMDGGVSSRPDNQRQVENNLSGMVSALAAQNAQICFLQEVDVDSDRSYGTDQAAYYRHGLSMNAAFAYNYRCRFVPYPWPPIGKVNSGVCTLTKLRVTEASRESMSVPFSWPLRVANLKRCMLIERVPVQDTDKELVLINFHLDAYDNGEGKAAQTKELMAVIKAEYRNGNYVIAGGDFNQTFEGVTAIGGHKEGVWQPGAIRNSDLPQGVRLVYDASRPSCRSLDAPYNGDRENFVFFILDGFLLTDNIKLNHVETIDLNFQHSDHNPVAIQFTLQ